MPAGTGTARDGTLTGRVSRASDSESARRGHGSLRHWQLLRQSAATCVMCITGCTRVSKAMLQVGSELQVPARGGLSMGQAIST